MPMELSSGLRAAGAKSTEGSQAVKEEEPALVAKGMGLKEEKDKAFAGDLAVKVPPAKSKAEKADQAFTGVKRLIAGEHALNEGSEAKRVKLEVSENATPADLLAEDAPPDHDAWQRVKKAEWAADGRFEFTIRCGNGQKTRFGTTLKPCYHDEAQAMRIARLCYVKMTSGYTKDQAMTYRNELYEQLRVAHEGGVAVPLSSASILPPSQASTELVPSLASPTTSPDVEQLQFPECMPQLVEHFTEFIRVDACKQGVKSYYEGFATVKAFVERLPHSDAKRRCLLIMKAQCRHFQSSLQVSWRPFVLLALQCFHPEAAASLQSTCKWANQGGTSISEKLAKCEQAVLAEEGLPEVGKYRKTGLEEHRQEEAEVVVNSDSGKKAKKSKKHEIAVPSEVTTPSRGRILELLAQEGRLEGSVEVKGRSEEKKNSTINGVYAPLKDGFAGHLAYELFPPGKLARYLFYASSKSRWKISDALEEGKGGCAQLKTNDATQPPVSLSSSGHWKVFDGKSEGYNEDPSVVCAWFSSPSAEASRQKPSQKPAQTTEVISVTKEAADSKSVSSSEASDSSSSESEMEKPVSVPVAEPPNPKAIQSQPPGAKISFKMLVRTGLRCACHYAYARNCPGNEIEVL